MNHRIFLPHNCIFLSEKDAVLNKGTASFFYSTTSEHIRGKLACETLVEIRKMFLQVPYS